MTDIEDGFYWVQYYGEWEVACKMNSGWWLTGGLHERPTEVFDQIGPKIELPENLE